MLLQQHSFVFLPCVITAIQGLSFNALNISEAATNPFNFRVRLIKISILYLFPVVSAGFILPVFHGVSLQELRIDRKFQCQAAAKRALCSILSASNNFVNCQAGICLSSTNSFFQMKILNKLAIVDVLVHDCNHLKDR